jgi:hypothetical protein
MSGSVSMVDGHIDPDKNKMRPKKAIILLSQMYLPQFDDEEKEALTMAIYALEKQIPERAIMKGFRPCEEICSVSYLCPVCKKHINIDKYCYHCGQALDWSDTK